METLIAWCGFLGAWLLVAGPVYQAAIELAEEDFEREEFSATVATVQPPARVSAWWWLLPPVMYVLARRRDRAHRELMIQALTPGQVEALVSFSAKSTGWFMVGAGGFLIAVKETWGLAEISEWDHVVFWVLLPAMSLVCVATTVLQVRRGRSMLALSAGS